MLTTYGEQLNELAESADRPIDKDVLKVARLLLDGISQGRAAISPENGEAIQIELHEQGIDVEISICPEFESKDWENRMILGSWEIKA